MELWHGAERAGPGAVVDRRCLSFLLPPVCRRILAAKMATGDMHRPASAPGPGRQADFLAGFGVIVTEKGTLGLGLVIRARITNPRSSALDVG